MCIKASHHPLWGMAWLTHITSLESWQLTCFILIQQEVHDLSVNSLLHASNSGIGGEILWSARDVMIGVHLTQWMSKPRDVKFRYNLFLPHHEVVVRWCCQPPVNDHPSQRSVSIRFEFASNEEVPRLFKKLLTLHVLHTITFKNGTARWTRIGVRRQEIVLYYMDLSTS